MTGPDRSPRGPRWWLVVLTLLGAFLTIRGYHCLDGDQAYRLPILLHSANPSLSRRPVCPVVRRVQPAPGLVPGHRHGRAAARAAGRARAALRAHLRHGGPRDRPPGAGRLARGRGGRRARRLRPGAGGPGRQHRHEPPVRAGLARPPDGIRAWDGSRWRWRSRGPDEAHGRPPFRSPPPRWCIRRSVSSSPCSSGPAGASGCWCPGPPRPAGGGRSGAGASGSSRWPRGSP